MTTTNTPGGTSNPVGGSPRLYTVQEAADLLRISTWTLQKLIRERQLGSIKVGSRRLVPTEDFERFVSEQRTGRIRGGFHG
ncbi:helix-turn-helix domain-containing protein [Microbacterium sp.]|uniref:helix-turn-helix domain-containing protein n=1 Tax=Microbacterium sp. TaxID=51671 RepID=UPI0027EFC011|nr:helix-turn-helix domain-containing protein [Microbacterium sp.]